MNVLQFWIAHRAEFVGLLLQHLGLVAVSTTAAVAIGIPLAIFATRRPHLGAPIIWLVNVAQTIPSLAMFGFLLPLPFIGGLGARVAITVLIVYALLPIVRTTVAGIRSVDSALVEAGTALGMTPRQLLRQVQLPLALPSIVAGIRVAAVIGVGTATIAAAVGAGGLGEYIFRGLAMVDTTTILAGAVPAALLALTADGLLAWAERGVRTGQVRIGMLVTVGGAAAAIVILAAGAGGYVRSTSVVVVGSKNFTEQVILGELLAQAIEAEGATVSRKLNLGGTFVCDRALRTGDIDVYVEYSGTAVTAVFHEAVPRESGRALEQARALYAAQGLSVVQPLGFNNTFAILVRRRDAQALALQTIDDLHRTMTRWTAGFGYEFLQRDDGYPGLVRAYDLRFASEPRGMDLSLIYRALAEGQVDVIAGDATNALIDSLELQLLADNRQYFPPYDAIPVVRTAALLREPAIGRALARLAGRISDHDMRAMNAAVDLERRDPKSVAAEFISGLGAK